MRVVRPVVPQTPSNDFPVRRGGAPTRAPRVSTGTLALSLATIVSLAPALASAVLIDRIAVVVTLPEEREAPLVLTVAEVRFEAAVAALLAGPPTDPAGKPLALNELTPGTVDGLVAKRLLAREAERLGALRVEAAVLDRAVENLRSAFPSADAFDDFLRAHQADLEWLRAVLASHLRVREVLESKLWLRARPTEQQLKEAHRLRPDGRPYEEVRRALSDELTRERFAVLVQRELERVLARAEVRRVAPGLVRAPATPRDAPGTAAPGASERGRP